mgnify:CR=1 FL=1
MGGPKLLALYLPAAILLGIFDLTAGFGAVAA